MRGYKRSTTCSWGYESLFPARLFPTACPAPLPEVSKHVADILTSGAGPSRLRAAPGRARRLLAYARATGRQGATDDGRGPERPRTAVEANVVARLTAAGCVTAGARERVHCWRTRVFLVGALAVGTHKCTSVPTLGAQQCSSLVYKRGDRQRMKVFTFGA